MHRGYSAGAARAAADGRVSLLARRDSSGLIADRASSSKAEASVGLKLDARWADRELIESLARHDSYV